MHTNELCAKRKAINCLHAETEEWNNWNVELKAKMKVNWRIYFCHLKCAFYAAWMCSVFAVQCVLFQPMNKLKSFFGNICERANVNSTCIRIQCTYPLNILWCCMWNVSLILFVCVIFNSCSVHIPVFIMCLYHILPLFLIPFSIVFFSSLIYLPFFHSLSSISSPVFCACRCYDSYTLIARKHAKMSFCQCAEENKEQVVFSAFHCWLLHIHSLVSHKLATPGSPFSSFSSDFSTFTILYDSTYQICSLHIVHYAIHICLQRNKIAIRCKSRAEQNPMQFIHLFTMNANSLTLFHYIYNSGSVVFMHFFVHIFIHKDIVSSLLLRWFFLSSFHFVCWHNVKCCFRFFVCCCTPCESTLWEGGFIVFDGIWVNPYFQQWNFHTAKPTHIHREKENESEITLAVCSMNLHFCTIAKLQASK